MSELTLPCHKCGHPLPAEMSCGRFIVILHDTTCPKCGVHYEFLGEVYEGYVTTRVTAS